MFSDDIISIDEEITGNIYITNGFHRVLMIILLKKPILDCINDKNVLNFLIYVFMQS